MMFCDCLTCAYPPQSPFDGSIAAVCLPSLFWQRERFSTGGTHNGRLQQMPELFASIHATGSQHLGVGIEESSPGNEERLRRILCACSMKTNSSAFGIRSLSKVHQQHPRIR
jgi:hypothetical protein